MRPSFTKCCSITVVFQVTYIFVLILMQLHRDLWFFHKIRSSANFICLLSRFPDIVWKSIKVPTHPSREVRPSPSSPPGDALALVPRQLELRLRTPVNNFHKIQNFRKISDLFSQIWLKKRHTSLFSGIWREIRKKIHQKFAEKCKIRIFCDWINEIH